MNTDTDVESSAGSPAGDGPAPQAPGGTRGVDLRLTLGAVSAWAAVLIGMSHGWRSLVVAAVLLALAGGIVVARPIGRRGGSTWTSVGLCAMCAAGALLPLAAAIHRTRAAPVSEWAARRTTVVVLLRIEGPARPAGTGPGGTARVAVPARMVVADPSGRPAVRVRLSVPVVVLAGGEHWVGLHPGQQVRVSVRLLAPRPGELTAGLAIPRGPPSVVSAGPWWQRAAERVRVNLRQACSGLPEPVGGLLPGLVDGDTAGLDPVLAEQFRVAGLTHLTAVSGTNLAVLVALLVPLVRRFNPRPVLVIGVGLGAVVGFLLVAGPQPSVVRAAVMGTIGVCAMAFGRPRDGLPALSAAVLGLLCWRPEWARDPGFALSVLASGALLLLAPGWSAALRRRRVPAVIADGLAVAAAATVVTAPVIAVLGGRVSLVSVPANLLAEPVVPAVTVLGVAAAATAWCCPWAGTALAWLAAWPARWLVHVAQWCSGVPGASVDWPATLRGAGVLAVVLAAGLVLIRRRAWRVWLGAAALTAAVVQVPVRAVVSGWPVPGWVLTACDIGQGDGLVLPAGRGSAVVVDTGPGPVAIDRCLRSLSINRLPLVVLTHFDLDHVGGIAGVVRERAVGEVVTGSTALSSAGHSLVDRVLASRGRRVRAAAPGEVFDLGGLRLTSLWPPAGYHPRADDSNDTSLVLRAEIGGVRILLTGDLGPEGQRDLVASHVDVRADVLKVMHHGSRFFDPAFITAVHPRVAVISVGVDNDYGHPAPSLLAALARASIPVLRTDRDGAVEIVSTPAGVRTAVHATPRSEKVVGAGPVRSAGEVRPPGGTDGLARRAGGAALSACRATMTACRPPRTTTSTNLPAESCSWWGTRSTWSPAPSSRSPPPPAGRIRTPTSSNGPAPRWRRPNWPRR